MHDLSKEFCDGVKLCTLVAALQGRSGIKGMKANPKNRHQKIENATLALQATKMDKVKLVNIGPEDIVNGNKKLILGLVWSYILRYQIGKTEIPPKQLMLAWLNAVIPSCNIKNFTTDWNNGKALNALIEYCEPGLAPDWRNLSPADSESNCEHAMRLAQERLGVPMVVSPQHMASADIDQLSVMTYLSYFMKMDSCGYKATLREVNRLLLSNPVFNFTSDWRDGNAVCGLVESVGGLIPDRAQLDTTDALHTTSIGLQAAKEIGIEPILSAKDMVQPQAGHLAVMAYAARFINKPAVRQSAAKHVEIMFNTVNIAPGSKTQYSLMMKHGDPRLHTIEVTVTDPMGKRVPTALEWQEDNPGRGMGSFTPTVTGAHMLRVECDGETIRGCPIGFNVTGSGKAISVVKRDQGVVGEISKLEILCDTESSSDVQMICTAPSGERKEVELSRSLSGRSLKNSFVPDAASFILAGVWQVSVLCKGEHAAGSPFNMNVINPEAVKLYNLEGGVIGEQFSFMGENAYSLKFVPTGPGVHLIRPMFGGKDVRDEPYKVEIADSNRVSATGQGLSLAKIHQLAKFTVDVGTSNAGTGDVTVNIKDSKGGEVPCRVQSKSERIYEAEYRPEVIGNHELVVKFADKQIRESPFTVNVYNDPSAEVPDEGIVGQPVTIVLNTADTGTGDLNIIVDEGRVPVETSRLGKGKHCAEFTPKDLGLYKVELEFNGFPIQGSPWYVNVTPAPAARSRSATPPLPAYHPAPPPLITSSSSSVSSASSPPPPPEPPQPIYSQIFKKPKTVTTETSLVTPATQIDPAAIVSKPPAAQYARVGELRSFDVSTSKVKVKIQDEFGSQIPYKTKKKDKGAMFVSYTFTHIGDHWIHLTARTPIIGSPFLVYVFDPNLVKVYGLLEIFTCGVPSVFTVDARRAGKGEITVQVDQGNVPCSVESSGDGLYQVSYISNTVGTRNIDILFNKCPVKGSPFYSSAAAEEAPPAGRTSYVKPIPTVSTSYVVPPPAVQPVSVAPVPPAATAEPLLPDYSAIRVHGDGLNVVEEDKVTTFFISHAGEKGQPDVRIEGRHSVARCDVQAMDDDQYKVSYIPVETGLYNIHVKWNGRDLEGSPFCSKAVNPRKVRLEGDWATHSDEEERLLLQVSQTKRLLFDISKAGPGKLSAAGKHLSTGAPLQCVVSERDEYHYWVDIVAGEPGDAVLKLTFGGYHIPNSPLSALVSEPTVIEPARRNRVLLTGDGYLEPTVGKISNFYIDGSLAEKGVPQVTLKNSKLEVMDVTLEQLSSDQEYRCSYLIDQSEKIHVHGPGVLPGILANFDGTFYIDTEGAGKGDCEVKIKGPKGDVKYRSSLEGPKKRLIQCIYEPTEVGLYVVYVKWSGEEIVESPIKVYIFDTYDELNKFKDNNELPRFMIPQDNLSLDTYSSPTRRAIRTRSEPVNGNLVLRGPPIRANTTGPRYNNAYEGKLSYFVVEENSPIYRAQEDQKQSVFIANH
ncbi:filamin-B-like [Watersipora subatra]|uniref:filamin-B-like n=1 Tax=Watersipora subatra TaxID=2589382 RepID=UPI00355C5D32